MADTKTMYESATERARVYRGPELVQLVVDGQGALVCDTMEFRVAQKWAQARYSTGIAMRDRWTFLENIPTMAVRQGTTFTSSRGSNKALFDLARKVVSAGMDLHEWQFPPAVVEELEKRPDAAALPAQKDAVEQEAGAQPAPAERPPEPESDHGPVTRLGQSGPQGK